MGEQLGKIEKPAAEEFEHKRKLFLVPLLYSNEDAPEDYKSRIERYWEQARQHVGNLERKIGGVSRMYHESVAEEGAEGMKLLERLNPGSYKMIKERYDQGVSLEAIEQRERVEEVMDWERCMMIGLVSQKVANQIYENYRDASKRRNEFILKRIDETLKENEAGLLFMREGHQLQFGSDVEVFSVYPPALDEFHRFLRDKRQQQEAKAAEGGEGEAKAEGGEEGEQSESQAEEVRQEGEQAAGGAEGGPEEGKQE